jgi:hypothetical protein
MIFFLIGFAIITSWIAMKTNLIRDELNDIQRFRAIATATGKQNPKPPFSLAKTQLTFWTIIILSSFLSLYIHNEKSSLVPELTNVSLILLGISVGTTTLGKVIDESQKDNFRHQNNLSKGLLIDILSDEKGVSVHRLQNVIWNIIVGFIYIRFVFVEINFPDEKIISDQLLALMGISSAAYLGIKVTENNKNLSDPSISGPALAEDDVPDSYKKTPTIPSIDISSNVVPKNGIILQKNKK